MYLGAVKLPDERSSSADCVSPGRRLVLLPGNDYAGLRSCQRVNQEAFACPFGVRIVARYHVQTSPLMERYRIQVEQRRDPSLVGRAFAGESYATRDVCTLVLKVDLLNPTDLTETHDFIAAVQQHQDIIAVNYPARAVGVVKHMSPAEV